MVDRVCPNPYHPPECPATDPRCLRVTQACHVGSVIVTRLGCFVSVEIAGPNAGAPLLTAAQALSLADLLSTHAITLCKHLARGPENGK